MKTRSDVDLNEQKQQGQTPNPLKVCNRKQLLKTDKTPKPDPLL